MRRPDPTSVERSLKEDDFIVSKTDLKGRIIYGNKMFIELSGYTEEELLNKPHSILRHPDMPKVIFKLLWNRIQNGQEIFAYVKNLCKDGAYYWVFANVTVTKDMNGNARDYHSVRRKPHPKALETIKPLYAKLLDEERSGGLEASERLLNSILQEKGVGYDEFILGLHQ
ncbi:PAS domain-containing protein [Hydrogenimonas sp.]